MTEHSVKPDPEPGRKTKDDEKKTTKDAPENWVDPEGPDLSIPENQPYDPADFPDAPEPAVDPRVPQSNPINF